MLLFCAARLAIFNLILLAYVAFVPSVPSAFGFPAVLLSLQKALLCTLKGLLGELYIYAALIFLCFVCSFVSVIECFLFFSFCPQSSASKCCGGCVLELVLDRSSFVAVEENRVLYVRPLLVDGTYA